jgi:DNA invertase Pin-like site-specific DNA recombinase
MKTRAVAYLRVSTEKQADGGVSLDAQRAKVEAYAALYDLELVAVIVDAGVSAKTLEKWSRVVDQGLIKRRPPPGESCSSCAA